ncbi:ALG6, ALG8 glycosyltransferase family-domain-containing protein [Gautieria morchelliformis]|nr:ALG6, ALG8 glycosyltransferase family-domain-containing protein [Gautieria morchelliformis]
MPGFYSAGFESIYRCFTGSSEVSQSEIHAPVPRRHHLLQTESQKWMYTPSISPGSSRPVSPTMAHDRLSRHPQLSFSALLEQPAGQKRVVDEQCGWARKWVRWMHRSGMRGWVIPVSMVGAAWIKWLVSLGGYSGFNTPPMFGDYEAQRHWLEITIHLPLRQWYTYDLPYWGLDYPPLTAYHSWLCGKIGSWIEPSWFALDVSRGYESEDSKTFMRATVLLSDILVYFPAVFLFVKRFLRHRSGRTQHVALLSLLLQPAVILIDSGHFQYNSVMLGFALLALDSLVVSSDLTAAVFFVLSLAFKQMALYYAPAIGSYLLGKCLFLGPHHGRSLFFRLAATTILTVLLLFLPWLSPAAIRNPLSRIFPFNRGLFEDKVANFWCASDVVVKWRRWLGAPGLVRLSTIFTAAGFAPMVWGLLYGAWSAAERTRGDNKKQDKKRVQISCPTLVVIPYALLTSSLSFFLFSFQVHEKSVLLPLMPATLLISGAESGGVGEDWEWGILFNNVAVFSMWPLLKKDGLGLQYVAVTLLWNRAIGYSPLNVKSGAVIRVLSLSSYGAILALHIAETVVTPPARYPDLFPVLNVLISAAVFGCTWLWSIKRGAEIGWALAGPPRPRDREPKASSVGRRSVHKMSVEENT